MFKNERSDATRTHIFRTALELFRTKGFDKTTMREVAKQSGLSLGAAYYYFRNKEDIVGAYYEHVQQEHLRHSREGFAKARNLKQRLAAALHGKLDVVADDRVLMTALFRYGGDPNHPLCWSWTRPRRQTPMTRTNPRPKTLSVTSWATSTFGPRPSGWPGAWANRRQ